LDRLANLADFILIEADGSKQLPIKAWADHEPVLPTCTSMVLILAGLSCLEKPLSAACHRPHLAAECASDQANELLQVLQDYIADPRIIGEVTAQQDALIRVD
jgi:probable selenium-dependent hydroxylase accessory protein YqeC